MLQAQNYETNLELNQTLDQIPITNDTLSSYSKIEELIADLENITSRGPYDLRAHIQKSLIEYNTNDSKEEYQSLAAQQGSPDDQEFSNCSPHDPIDDWMNCKISEYLAGQFHNITIVLNEDIPSELIAINDSSILPQIKALGFEIQRFNEELNTNFSEHMKTNPQFWKTYTGKTHFYGDIRLQLHNIWINYGVDIKNSLNNKLNYLKSKTLELEDQRNITERNKAELSNRLEKLESPVGTIPIGLSQSVVVFPIALASGFAVYSYFFSCTVKLRKALYLLYKKENPNEDIEIKNKMSLITPLWIEPTHSSWEKISKLAILLIPFGLFIISWILISDSWSKILFDDMRTSFPYNKELYKQFYYYLYVFSLIFFVYGLFSIFNQLYYYNQHKAH